MKRYSAQYIITNSSQQLKRGIVTIDEDGTITGIEDTGGNLSESDSVEYHNGIIIPGFVNAHCHLELSHMKSRIAQGSGLDEFIFQVRNTRESDPASIYTSVVSADNEMFNEGISLCADICNTISSFDVKTSSRIGYLNLLEVFGIDPYKATRRLSDIEIVAHEGESLGLECSLTPHSLYSMSLNLLRLLKEKSSGNKVTSIHFMETPSEKEFLEKQSGALMESYKRSRLVPPMPETVANHITAILDEITDSGNLILVHNTFADKELVSKIKQRMNLYWCLCPNSNLYIEKTIPPVDMLLAEGCKLVVGTDSLASNTRLSILQELITLQQHFPMLSIQELVLWSTLNGAEALGKEDVYGKIETGKKPGLLLLQNVDLINMKLLPESLVTRLV